MKENKILIIVAFLAILTGCSRTTEPELKGTLPAEKTMTLSLDQKPEQTVAIEALRNGYVKGELVMLGYGEGFRNTLMLTFRLKQNGIAEINRTMTGYWDLGVCIPINKFILTDESSNYIKINSYDERTNIVQGEFNLRFRYEKDTTKTAEFSRGKFNAVIDTSWSFKYCTEG